MPKLIVKQDVMKAPWQRMIYWVMGVVLVLLILFAYFFFIDRTPIHKAMRDLPRASQEAYQKQYNDLQHLIQGYKVSSQYGKETLAKNQQLIAQINIILDQLLTMSAWVKMEAVEPNVQQALLANLQYDMDVWNGNLRFRELRASRLEVENPTKQAFQFAKPEEGMVLPEGFCALNSLGSCKASDEDTNTQDEKDASNTDDVYSATEATGISDSEAEDQDVQLSVDKVD